MKVTVVERGGGVTACQNSKGGPMPGNTVKINNSFEYYVGDSRMKELFNFLDEIGFREGLAVGDHWPYPLDKKKNVEG